MINLHVHTNKSLDGVLDINEVLNICEDNKISYVSITDHNTCEAYQELKDNKFTGTLIYGIEADALIGKETYDILCYGFDLEKINNWAKKQYLTIEERQTKIFNILKEICNKKNIPLSITKPYNPKEEYAHAAIFRMLEDSFKEKYNITSTGDLYRESSINESFPLYMDMSIVWPTIEEIRDIIHDNGGLVFLAHPFRYGSKDVTELLEQASPYVDGIEVYNNNTKDETDFLYKYAQDNNLLISCGSDFHGDDYKNKIKTDLDDELQTKIIKWIDNNLNSNK